MEFLIAAILLATAILGVVLVRGRDRYSPGGKDSESLMPVPSRARGSKRQSSDLDIDDIIQAAGSVATDTLPGDEPIDICQVTKGEKGISHFITEHITPFYERRWGGFLRDLKTNRII